MSAPPPLVEYRSGALFGAEVDVVARGDSEQREPADVHEQVPLPRKGAHPNVRLVATARERVLAATAADSIVAQAAPGVLDPGRGRDRIAAVGARRQAVGGFHRRAQVNGDTPGDGGEVEGVGAAGVDHRIVPPVVGVEVGVVAPLPTVLSSPSSPVMLSLYLVPIRVLSPSLPVLIAAEATAEHKRSAAPAMTTNKYEPSSHPRSSFNGPVLPGTGMMDEREWLRIVRRDELSLVLLG